VLSVPQAGLEKHLVTGLSRKVPKRERPFLDAFPNRACQYRSSPLSSSGGETSGLGGAEVGEEDQLGAVGEEVLELGGFAAGDLAVD
jgi:hypothetical protein